MIANECIYNGTSYFIYWIEKQEILGVTNGCSVVFEERFERNRRSDWLKTELTEVTWRRIVEGNEILIDHVSINVVRLKRNTRTVEILKCTESDVAEKMARNFRLLVEVAKATRKTVDEKTKPAVAIHSKPVVTSKPRGFMLPVKKKAKLEDDDEIVE